MMDGIVDNFKVARSMVFKDRFKPDVDENGNIIQSKKQSGAYIKMFRQDIQDGKILRYSAHLQISPLATYKEFDICVNKRRQEEADKLNEKYYGKEKYLKIKQCMP